MGSGMDRGHWYKIHQCGKKQIHGDVLCGFRYKWKSKPATQAYPVPEAIP